MAESGRRGESTGAEMVHERTGERGRRVWSHRFAAHCLVQRKVHSDQSLNLDGGSLENIWLVSPLGDRVERSLGQRRLA